MGSEKKRILIITAVTAEKEAVLRGLQNVQGIDVIEAGVGPVAAAVNTAKTLAAKDYQLVISTGIGGGFPGKAAVGTLAVADEIIGADLGSETQEGFSSLEMLGFGSIRVQADMDLVTKLTDTLRVNELPVTTGPIITVSTVTGTAASAREMQGRVPKVAAEGMEGYGVALAAQSYGVPVLEIRAISNQVGPRDRDAWRIKEALDILEKAYSVLAEEYFFEP